MKNNTIIGDNSRNYNNFLKFIWHIYLTKQIQYFSIVTLSITITITIIFCKYHNIIDFS